MLQAIKRAHHVDPENPDLHTCLVRYKLYLKKYADTLEEPVQCVIDEVRENFEAKNRETQRKV